jgi:MFS family permease
MDKRRGAARLMLDPVFGPYIAGKLLSTAGVWIHSIVAAILAFELSGSTFIVGLVSVAQFVPQLVLAPWAGKRADQFDRLRQVIAGRSIAAGGSFGLAIWIVMSGHEGLANAIPVIAMSFIVGLGFVIGGPAMQAMIPSLVEPTELSAAIALNGLPMTLARAGGPALGVLLLGVGGPTLAFSVAACGNLVFAAILIYLPIASGQSSTNEKDVSVSAALRYIRADRSRIRLLLGIAAVGFGADPAITLAPAVSAELTRGTELVGGFASAFGIGAAIAFLAIGRADRRLSTPTVASLGLGIIASGWALLVFSGRAWSSALAFAVAGFGFAWAVAGLSTQLLESSPDGLRGRIMAFWSMGFLGSRPLASALNGVVADALSVDVALVVVSLIVGLAALAVRPSQVLSAVVDVQTGVGYGRREKDA